MLVEMVSSATSRFLPFANSALTTASCWNPIPLKDMDKVGYPLPWSYSRPGYCEYINYYTK